MLGYFALIHSCNAALRLGKATLIMAASGVCDRDSFSSVGPIVQKALCSPNVGYLSRTDDNPLAGSVTASASAHRRVLLVSGGDKA